MNIKLVPEGNITRLAYMLFGKKNTVYFRTFISYTIIIVSIIMAFGVIVYLIFSSIFIKEVSNANKHIIETESKIINQEIVDFVEDFSIKLITEQEWTNMEYLFNNNSIDTYNRLNDGYIFLKSKVYSSWDIVDSISIYFNNMNMILSSKSGLTFLDTTGNKYSFEKDIFNNMKEKKLCELWTGVRTIRETAVPQKKVFSYIRLYPYGSKLHDAKGCIIVDINHNALERIICCQGNKWGSTYIISQDNSIIASSDGNYGLFTDQKIDLMENTANDNVYCDDAMLVRKVDNMVCSLVLLSNNDWRLVRIVPLKIWNDKLDIVKYLLVTICLTLMGIGTLLSRFALNRIHSPLKSVIRYISEMPRRNICITTEKDTNEYTVLENTIISLSKRISEIEHTLDNNRKLLKRNLFACILLNSIDDTNKLYDFMKLVSIEMPYPYFGVILLKLPSTNCYGNFNSKKGLQSIEDELNNFIETNRQPGFICYAACVQSYYDKGYVSILFNAENQNREWIMERAESIYFSLKEYCKLDLKASVGRIVEDLKDVQLSREDAETLMKYTYFKSGSYAILGDLDVLNRERSNDIIPDYLFERYNKALKKLDIVSIQKSITNIILEMKNKNYSEAYCMAKLSEMVNTFVKRLESYAEIDYNSREAYETIMSANNIDELQAKLFRELRNVLGCTLSEKTDECVETTKTTQELVCMAKDYIMENLDKDISLLTVSDFIGISPQYLSKLFKEETGENFVNFVTRKRMEKAKNIIDENLDINIEEVCYLVGYNNTSYFIKKFKEIYDITPNSYRNILKTS